MPIADTSSAYRRTRISASKNPSVVPFGVTSLPLQTSPNRSSLKLCSTSSAKVFLAPRPLRPSNFQISAIPIYPVHRALWNHRLGASRERRLYSIFRG
ncbi:hypothetical protein FOFC_20576 [Fusarium oxysporum]|nr:hypothetical protein FOFC_20576 [Fusarium oxysporum]